MIRTEELVLKVGDFQLGPVGLEVNPGEYFVLLGPPGSGKSLLLESVCGLKRIQSGAVFIDGRNATRLEPRERRIAYVPQDYALFPHMSVAGNIGFGITARRLASREIRTRVEDTAELLGISHLLDRSIEGLSGGEKQRVALGRALASRSKILLMDEPVSALADVIRQEVCAELRRLQRELDLTVIHVSHNLEEAFLVADRATVVNAGQLHQVGTMEELLRKPRDRFVARFMRCENILPADVLGGTQSSGEVIIRPEDIDVYGGADDVPAIREATGEAEFLAMTLKGFSDCGSYVRLEMSGKFDLTVHLSSSEWQRLGAEAGDRLTAVLPLERVHSLPAEEVAEG